MDATFVYQLRCQTCAWERDEYSGDAAYNTMTRHQRAAYLDDQVAGTRYPTEHVVTIEPIRR